MPHSHSLQKSLVSSYSLPFLFLYQVIEVNVPRFCLMKVGLQLYHAGLHSILQFESVLGCQLRHTGVQELFSMFRKTVPTKNQVQRVLALCEFLYCNFSKNSINFPYANFGLFCFNSAIFWSKNSQKTALMKQNSLKFA